MWEKIKKSNIFLFFTYVLATSFTFGLLTYLVTI